MALNVIQDTPDPVLDIDFIEPDISSNYGDWDDKSRVRYAVQLRVDGTYSKFSEWTEPLKIDGKANPTLQVPRDEKGRERLVFRRFNDEKPQLAGVLKKSQVEFRDIDRDIYNAARSKDQARPLEYIPALLDAGGHINKRFEMKRSAMHAAAEAGNVKIAMRFLLDETKELINSSDEKGFTPAHIAASTKNAGFINFLSDQNADLNAQTTVNKLTPLHIAAKRGYSSTVKNLLANEKIKINQPEKSGYTPLHYAVRGTSHTIQLLLSNDKILVNAKSDFGFTPFHLAVMKGDIEICDALLSSGKVEVNAGNKDNMTPLHFAAMTGNVEMIKYLLSGKKEVEKVDINAVTSDNNWTPLYLAIYFKQEDAALELLKNDKINVSITSKEKYTPLQLTVATGQVRFFDELLKKDSNLESLTKELFTALHLAALRDETDFTVKLLDKNVNINAVSDDGSTPLHLASKSDKKDEILILINRGANMKLYDSKKFLPLQFVVKNINLEALRAAVQKDPSIVDTESKDGKELINYALEFILSGIYHYYKNKDSGEYFKYKDLQPLEVFNKMGYYDIIRILQNDPSGENVVNSTIILFDTMSADCIKRESNPNKEPCISPGVRSGRSIGSIDSYEYKMRPINFVRNSVDTNWNVNNRNFLEMKSTQGSKSFSSNKSSMVQGVDTNGILLLLDLFARKLTNKKYNMNVWKPASPLESQAAALNIIEKFTDFVNSVSDVPAEELIDLAKLHSNLYKSIESANGNKIYDILCDQLLTFVSPDQLEAALSRVINEKEDSDQQNIGNSVKDIAQHCLDGINKNKEF